MACQCSGACTFVELDSLDAEREGRFVREGAVPADVLFGISLDPERKRALHLL